MENKICKMKNYLKFVNINILLSTIILFVPESKCFLLKLTFKNVYYFVGNDFFFITTCKR